MWLEAISLLRSVRMSFIFQFFSAVHINWPFFRVFAANPFWSVFHARKMEKSYYVVVVSSILFLECFLQDVRTITYYNFLLTLTWRAIRVPFARACIAKKEHILKKEIKTPRYLQRPKYITATWIPTAEATTWGPLSPLLVGWKLALYCF